MVLSYIYEVIELIILLDHSRKLYVVYIAFSCYCRAKLVCIVRMSSYLVALC